MGKRKERLARWRFPAPRGLRLLFLCCFFLLGVVIGHILARLTGSDPELQETLLALSSRNAEELGSSLWQVLLAYLRFPLLALLLGYCGFALAAIPMLMAIQGFSLSFAASVLILSTGTPGIPLVLASFGLRGLITIVCTLMFALCSFEQALGHDGMMKKAAKVILVCFFLLMLGVILELTAMPVLFLSALAELK